MKIKLGIIIVLFATLGFITGLFTTKIYLIKSSNQTASIISATNSLIDNTETKKQPDETKLFFVGDIMLDRAVRTSVVKNFNNDYSALFKNLSELKEADILFGNLEGNISDIGNNVGSKYSFRMDPVVLPAIKDAGFDIVSFANNHVGDWNIPAFKDTIIRLSNIGILKTGAGSTKYEAGTPTIIDKNGIKFGFLGFSDVGPDWISATDEKPGILLASDPRLPEIIKSAKSRSDVLIVSFHWGEEYKKIHNNRQELLAHTAIDNGADIVVGHHPHVIQDIESYRDRPIVYSLGNFIFDQYFSKDTMQGMLFSVNFSGKNIKETSSKIITLNKKYQPEGIFSNEQEAMEARLCPKPDKKYDDYTYLDVGQKVAIPDKTYVPSDLVLLDKSITTVPTCLKKDASDAISTMILAAKMDGYDIKVSSGFRSYATQKAILENNIKNGNKNAHRLIAKPGYSEHQLGVAVDLTGASIKNISAATKFKDSVEDKWLEIHASEYGFVESYPEDKEDVTGYMNEDWHYRYVGIENAKEIIANEQTINEFLKAKKDKEAGEVQNKTTQ